MLAWLKRLWERFRPYAKKINPQVIACVDRQQAETAARAFAKSDPLYIVRSVDGRTGSMLPLIPARPAVAVIKRIPFADARAGIVGTYQPEFDTRMFMHRLVSKDGLGFLASGDNNSRTESWARVTEKNFDGEVVGVWHYPA